MYDVCCIAYVLCVLCYVPVMPHSTSLRVCASIRPSVPPQVQVVDHVEGVSRSLQQMHMQAASVRRREQTTVGCIAEYANRMYDLMHLCRATSSSDRQHEGEGEGEGIEHSGREICEKFRQKLDATDDALLADDEGEEEEEEEN